METTISQWFFNRRDQLHIITEILKVAKYGTSKTCIMYNANLSFKGVKYINFLLENRLLLKTREDCLKIPDQIKSSSYMEKSDW